MVRLAISNARSGMGALTPAIALMSASFWIAWIELIYSGEIYLGSQEPSSLQIIVSYVLSTTAMASMLIVYGCVPRKVEPLLQKTSVVLGAGALAALSTFVSLLTGSIIATILTGVFTSPLAARFALLFAQVNPKAALLSIILAQIIASFVYGYVLALPDVWRPWVLCLLPFIAAFCSMIDGGQLRYEVPGPTNATTRNLLRFIVAVFLFSMAINIVRGFYPSTIEMDTFAEARGNSSVLFFFVKMGLACVALFLPIKTNLGKLCYYAFVLLAFLTVPLPLFGLGSSQVLELFGCINALLNIVIWTLIAGIAYKSGRSPIRLFGWVWGGMSLGSVVGWLVGFGLYAAGVDSSMMTGIEIIMLGIMLISCMFVVTWQVVDGLFDPVEEGDDSAVDRTLGAHEAPAGAIASDGNVPSDEEFSDSAAVSVAASPSESEAAGVEAVLAPIDSNVGEVGGELRRGPGRWRRAALEMAADYELSARECDVFELLLKGYTKQRVADELFIAYNTVRSHTRRIYSKCDAHSQQDLISLFESKYLEER